MDFVGGEEERPPCLPPGGLYHLWAEAIVGELPNKGQLVGPRLLDQVLLHSFHGLEVVLQQAARHTADHTASNQRRPAVPSGTGEDDHTFAIKK